MTVWHQLLLKPFTYNFLPPTLSKCSYPSPSLFSCCCCWMQLCYWFFMCKMAWMNVSLYCLYVSTMFPLRNLQNWPFKWNFNTCPQNKSKWWKMFWFLNGHPHRKQPWSPIHNTSPSSLIAAQALKELKTFFFFCYLIEEVVCCFVVLVVQELSYLWNLISLLGHC